MSEQNQMPFIPDDVLVSEADRLYNTFKFAERLRELAHWIRANKASLENVQAKVAANNAEVEQKSELSAILQQQIGNQRITLKKREDDSIGRIRQSRNAAETDRIDKRKQFDNEIRDARAVAAREVSTLREEAEKIAREIVTRTATLQNIETNISKLQGEVGQLSASR